SARSSEGRSMLEPAGCAGRWWQPWPGLPSASGAPAVTARWRQPIESPHDSPPRPRLTAFPPGLGAIGWRADVDPRWRQAMAGHPGARPARVVEQQRSGYVVADAIDRAFTVESPPQWQRPPGYRRGKVAPEDRAVVGDWVLVEDGRIVALLPRRSAIK